MINSLVTVLIIAVVAGLIWWVCDYMPVPEPLNKLIKVLTVVICAIAIIYVLLGIAHLAPALG
jgi:hypothetical protein